MTVPPVSTAISCSMALRRAPKPAASPARTVREPRRLVADLDGDDAVAAHAFHALGDQVADLLVGGGDGGDLGDLFLAFDGHRHVTDVGDDRLHALLDAGTQLHRVGAGGEVPEALVDDGLRQHGGGGGAVAGHVVGLGGGFLHQLCAHRLEGIFERDLLGDAFPSHVTGARDAFAALARRNLLDAGTAARALDAPYLTGYVALLETRQGRVLEPQNNRVAAIERVVGLARRTGP